MENLDGNAEEREVERQVCAAKGESEEWKSMRLIMRILEQMQT